MEHIKVSSVSEAWRAAARIFPTDYEKNEENSKRAGYPIYETTSTDERFSGFHISDLFHGVKPSVPVPDVGKGSGPFPAVKVQLIRNDCEP